MKIPLRLRLGVRSGMEIMSSLVELAAIFLNSGFLFDTDTLSSLASLKVLSFE